MVLLAADRAGVTEPKMITKTRERVTEALRVQIVRTRPSAQNSLQMMPALEAKIPELKEIGKLNIMHLGWLRSKWSLLRLPPLFAEIYDIPKYEGEVQ